MGRSTNKDLIYNYLLEKCNDETKKEYELQGCSTIQISEALGIKRPNASKALNELYEEGTVVKIKGKPVFYTINHNKRAAEHSKGFDNLVGAVKSLRKPIQQAKAAMLYPPRGLYTLILGETGVGKSMFAELMHRFAIENGVLTSNAPFITFNCADYANNPQLLLSFLFGAKKGSYTGLDKDRVGVVEKANNGILFLDEVHRLPPEGQEILFYLMDKGEFSPLGDTENLKKSNVLIICATTEDIETSLLATFTRRIPINITIPPLRDRTFEERYELVCEFLKSESERIGKNIVATADSLRSLLLYNCPGNIGQLKSDIQLGCANAFLRNVSKKEKSITIHSFDFAPHVRQGLELYDKYGSIINEIIDESKRLSFTPAGVEETSGLSQQGHETKNHPVVVVAMHGQSTASSMVEVAQKLAGVYNIYAFDRSLDKSSRQAYKELKQLIIKRNKGAGVILLVDMGSLKAYGNQIMEETGIKLKVVELTSTITVIECAIKAQIEKDIDNIWYSVNENNLKFYETILEYKNKQS